MFRCSDTNRNEEEEDVGQARDDGEYAAYCRHITARLLSNSIRNRLQEAAIEIWRAYCYGDEDGFLDGQKIFHSSSSALQNICCIRGEEWTGFKWDVYDDMGRLL